MNKNVLRNNTGAANHKWKGDAVGYNALHSWVARQLGKPSKCEHCDIPHEKYEWANKSGEYRRDLDDWIRLCVSCHRKYDGWAYKIWHKRWLGHIKNAEKKCSAEDCTNRVHSSGLCNKHYLRIWWAHRA